MRCPFPSLKYNRHNSGEINQEREISVKDHLENQQNVSDWHLGMTP